MKNHKPALLFLVAIICLIFSTGFQKEKSREAQIQALIDAKVAERIDAYRKEFLEKCRERILVRASELADTVILMSARKINIIDKTVRPTPPPRPLRPDVRIPADTTPVTPFFSIDTTQ